MTLGALGLIQILRYAHIWGVQHRHVQIYLVYSTALSDVNVLAVYLNIKSDCNIRMYCSVHNCDAVFHRPA